MGLGDLDNNEEDSMDHTVYTDLPNRNSIYGEPPISPRVGDQYQAEIPSLMTESERQQFRHSPIGTDDTTDYRTEIGLPIPIMWAHRLDYCTKHKRRGNRSNMTCTNKCQCIDSEDKKRRRVDLKHSATSECSLKCSDLHPEHAACRNEVLKCQNKIPGSTGYENTLAGNEKANKSFPLPDSPDVSWSDAEKRSFLLGVYIFGKNLVQVKNFMESKMMGEILSYYYGKFYRSDAHRRWSECRKLKSRKYRHGQHIFTGCRQQELLSRLVPSIPKEERNTLFATIQDFNEGTVSLEVLVSSLKAIVGMQVLVEAIGIGVGKRDLTGFIAKPARSNRSFSICPEIPTGRAWSALTIGQIIQFLKGDFRLSKAKSNDLFWEAVWPRLLARGWHSEQPKDLSYLDHKHGLVFLIPGVKKFLRRKLVKGKHYFDSVSDVLNKVASDPRLLDIETEESNKKSSSEKQCDSHAHTQLNQNDPPDRLQRRCLRPRFPNCNAELMKFTVIDTSSVRGDDASFRVRALRSLPVTVLSSDDPVETGSETSEQPESADAFLKNYEESDYTCGDKNSENIFQSDGSDRFLPVSEKEMPINGGTAYDKPIDLLKQLQPEKDLKQFSRKPRSVKPDPITPVSKRQRLNTCMNANNESHSNPNSRGQELQKEDTVCEMKIGAVCETKPSHEMPQPRVWFDLNLIPDDEDEVDEHVSNQVVGSQDVLNLKVPSPPSETHEQLDVSQVSAASNAEPSNTQSSINARRQSTRNRPPTTRALEALACGYLGTKRKWSSTKAPASDSLPSRTSRRPRKDAEASVSFVHSKPSTVNSNMDADIEKDEN